MRNYYDKQLKQLNNELIEMGELIEQQIEQTIKALVQQDTQLAMDTIAFDEKINRQERDIENLCMKLLLMQQPVASDLRLVSAALKLITDMERIGDHGADISELTLLLAKDTYIKKLEHIQQMAQETTDMVIKSIQAFVDRDQNEAINVMKQDDVVDQLFDKVKYELVELIRQNPANAEQATDLLMVAKYFERIGDHATNIAEWVVYAITGEHKSLQ